MLISLSWLRDFVDLPAELDPHELAERLTMVTAEVESVEHIAVEAAGLLAAEVLSCRPIAGTRQLWRTQVSTGRQQFVTVTAAEGLATGQKLLYAPPGAQLPGIGKVGPSTVADHKSEGMIVPGQAVGITQATQQAVFLPPSVQVGSSVDLADLADWVIEIDNKAITHRPDLWGHYGIAREVAAIYSLPLKPYQAFITPLEQMQDSALPQIPLVIDDPDKCPRYSGLLIDGLVSQPSPLWMQARLSHVGLRPIDLIVDLTNYVMAELAQPMHAFDGHQVDRIEVAVAKSGERFTTLDGLERVLPAGALMIQSARRNVAVAGIMGGSESEVTSATTRILLESANFEPVTIRRCASALGHRTEASARFEKSLDPANTVLGIARFVELAKAELPDLRMASTLSDCYPKKPHPVSVEVDLDFVDRFVGRHIERRRVCQILESLEFELTPTGDRKIRVSVPSFRATRDISMDADVIEEVARFVGYENIEPRLPAVELRRFEPNPLHRLERRSLEMLCGALGFAEIQSYIWYDASWLSVLGFAPGPCLTLRNPPASGLDMLRQTLVPDLLRSAERNRHHLERFGLVELGSVFLPAGADGRKTDIERRHLGLAFVLRGGGKDEDKCLEQIKAAVEVWAHQVLDRPAGFAAPSGESRWLWQHANKTAEVVIADRPVGYVTVVPDPLKGRIHQHLRRWSIALAELCLDGLVELPPIKSHLPPVPSHPQVQLDFSILADADRSFVQIADLLKRFKHPLLRRLGFLGSYHSPSLPVGTRSLTLRAWIGHPQRTLTEDDRHQFEAAFTQFLAKNDLPLRS